MLGSFSQLHLMTNFTMLIKYMESSGGVASCAQTFQMTLKYENTFGGDSLLWKWAWKYTYSNPNIGKRHSPFCSVGGGLWRQASRRTTADCCTCFALSGWGVWETLLRIYGRKVVQKARCHVTHRLGRIAASKDTKKYGLITGKMICCMQLCNARFWHHKGRHLFSLTIGHFLIFPVQL